MRRSLCDCGIVPGLKERVCRDSLGGGVVGVTSPYIGVLGKTEGEVDLNVGISDLVEVKLFKV